MTVGQVIIPDAEARAIGAAVWYPAETIDHAARARVADEDWSPAGLALWAEIVRAYGDSKGQVQGLDMADLVLAALSRAGHDDLSDALRGVIDQYGAGSSAAARAAVEDLADHIAGKRGEAALDSATRRLKGATDKRGALRDIAAAIAALAEGRARAEERTSEDYDDAALAGVLAVARGERQRGGVPLPLYGLDRALGGGLGPGLHVLAARSSMGKTLLEGQIARYAEVLGIPVVRVQCDQDMEAVARRDLCALAGVRIADAYAADTRLQDWLGLVASAKRRLPQTVLTDPDIDAISRRVRWMTTRPNPPALLTVDYVGALSDARYRAASETDRVGHTMERLRALARDAPGLAVLVLAQLNRESEKESRGVRLSDIAQSSNVENRADTVICIEPDFVAAKQMIGGEDWSDSVYRSLTPRPVRLSVLKSRDGRQTSCGAVLRGEWMAFEEPRTAPDGGVDLYSCRVDGLDARLRGRYQTADYRGLSVRLFCREWEGLVREEARRRGEELRPIGYVDGVAAGRA